MMIQGVLGPIDTAELGQTLMHEHITCADWSMRMNFGARFFEFDQVAEIAAGQLGKAKALGVRTVVDGTPVNLGRDIRLIREVARRTGLNFIASTGFYYQEEPWLYFRDEEEIYDLLLGACADGLSGTGSNPGILKAGVGRGGLTPLLQKVLHATGRVAKETGLPLFCHHDPSTAAGGAILDLLASCGDDCRVLFYDVRQAASVASLTAHAKEVNAVAFNPVEQFLFATGSSDATVALWDHRNTARPLHSLLGHKAEVYSLAWSPSSASVLASAGVDRRVNLWDISRVGV